MGSYLLVLLIIHVIQKRKKRIEEERRLRATALNLVQARTNLIKAKLLAEQGADTTRAEEQIQSSSNRVQISAEPNEDDDEALGHLFVDFFREIGVNLDFTQAISVRDSGSVFEKASR
jgi:DNA polymerase sigma